MLFMLPLDRKDMLLNQRYWLFHTHTHKTLTHKFTRKAGIGAEESSSDPPLPRFLGGVLNDSFVSLGARTLPLHMLVLSCDPFTFRQYGLKRWFVPLALHQASPSECFAVVKSMGKDCPSARSAPGDVWVAYLCGVAASLPPPLDPEAPRRLLTSLNGALQHLCSGIPRPFLLAAGLISTVTLQAEQPLTSEQRLEICGMFLDNQREPTLAGMSRQVFHDDLLKHMRNFVNPAFGGLHYQHPVIDQWLCAQWLALEDSTMERVMKKMSKKYPSLKDVAGPISSQQLPFIYSPPCVSKPVWRGVLHFIGVTTGVYPLAYRLCAWGDNSNIASYQWLLQLKSQSCSPMHHPTGSARKSPMRQTPLFEYHLHGDVGRLVFWILCRVQAEVSVANPSQAVEHGEENTFPHFVRATLANPRHAHDLSAALSDAIMAPALAKLHDGLSIGSHLADLCVEAGVARPWASTYYARLLMTLHDGGLLNGPSFTLVQCRALTASKSTSKRLFAATFLREHGIRNAIEDAELLLPLLLGVSDRSPFVREECLQCCTDLFLGVSPAFLLHKPLRHMLGTAIQGLSEMLRDPQQHRSVPQMVQCVVQLLVENSPLAALPVVLLAGTPEVMPEQLHSAMAALNWATDGAVLSAVERVFGGGRVFPAQYQVFMLDLLEHHLGVMMFVLGRTPNLVQRVVGPQLQTCAEELRPIVWRASCASSEGFDALADYLCRVEPTETGLVVQKALLRLLCERSTRAWRSFGALLRVAEAHPRFAGPILACLKGDRDEDVWLRRRLSDSLYLSVLQWAQPEDAGSEAGLARSLDALAIVYQGRRELPAKLAAAFIMATSRADTNTDSSLQSHLQVLSQLQRFCSQGLVQCSAGQGEDAQLLEALTTTVTLPSPQCHPALCLAVHTSCVRLAASLNPQVVTSLCVRVLAGDGSSPAPALFAAQVLALAIPPNTTLADLDMLVLLKRWEANARSHTAMLQLAEAMVLRKSLMPHVVASYVISWAISADNLACPLRREAALQVAKLCVQEESVAATEWVPLVMQEVARRAEAGVRSEEPGVVAALALVRHVVGRTLRAAQVVADYESILTSVLDNAAARKQDAGNDSGKGAGWNISVVSQCLGVIQELLQMDAQHSRFAHLIVSLSCDPALTSTELRKGVLRVMRSMPHAVLLQGLRLLAQGPKSNPRWNIFSKLRKSNVDLVAATGEPLHVTGSGKDGHGGEGETNLQELLAPIFRFHDRSSQPKERLALLELLSLVAFAPSLNVAGPASASGTKDADHQTQLRVESLICDMLRNASSAVSTDLSTLVGRHSALFLPHVWSMLASSIRFRTVANKWLTFLRKHYQPDQGSSMQLALCFRMEPTPFVEVEAALKGFANTCAGINRVEASLVFRLLGVVYDVSMRAPPHPSLWADVVAASQCATLALTDVSSAQSASEYKETALLLTIHMLGRWAAVASPPNSQWFEHLRPILDALPYGLGRHAWRLLENWTGALLF